MAYTDNRANTGPELFAYEETESLEVRRLRAQLAQSEAEQRRIIAALDREAKIEAALPDLAQFLPGNIITWDAVFDERSGRQGTTRVYSYTALLCDNNTWYTSGPRSPGPYSARMLAEFIAKTIVGDLYYVSELTAV